ncbi:TPA: ead/Ea22-like family protein [Enterobacter hormaechei subsp. xiangfangensis]|nr:ead/Ea22-like family protein [Enterobacter hormaechei subsp. xiangfangensis]
MSNIDKRGLREAAEKATKGRWAVEFDDEIYSTDGVNHEQIAMVFSENEARDAAFIAAANPATVLAMLDELESAEKRIAELSASHSKLRDTMTGIHNTIRMDGGYTPLAAILNAAKRAHEESATAAGIGVKGE